METIKSFFIKKKAYSLFLIISSVLLLSIFSIQSIKSSSPWNQIRVEPGRFNFSCIAVPETDDTYCMGGMGVVGGSFGTLGSNHVYNSVTGSWQEKAPIPDSTDGFKPYLVYWNGNIFLFRNNSGTYQTGSLRYYVYDVAQDVWETAPTLDFNEYVVGDNRINPIAASYYNEEIYLLHEYREGMSGDTQRKLRLSKMNPTVGTWTYEVHSMDVSAEQIRESASYATIGSKIYIFAGHDGTGAWRRSTLVYDIADNSFTAKADMPNFRQDGLVTVGADGKIYIFGGVPVPEELQLGVKTETVVSYNPATNSWSSEASLSDIASHGDAVLGSDGEMYVFLTQDGEASLPPINERPVLEYYIDQSYDVSWNIDDDAGIYKAYAPSLAVALCSASFQRCNYHVTPGTENRSFQLNPVLSDGMLVATPDEFSMANMAFLAPVGDTMERIVLRFAPNVSISGGTDWDGVFQFPSFLNEASINPEGDDVEVDKVVKLGGNVSLSLSAPARLVIPGGGEDGYRVGYVEPESDEFVEINTTCNEDTLEAVSEQLGEGEACKIVVEAPDEIAPEYLEPKRLVVWTTHFTEFVTYQSEDVDSELGDKTLPRTGFLKKKSPGLYGYEEFFKKFFVKVFSL